MFDNHLDWIDDYNEPKKYQDPYEQDKAYCDYWALL